MNTSHVLCPVVLFCSFAVACVNNLKVILLVWVVAIDSIGGYLLGNVMECAGRESVSTGTGVRRISVWGLFVEGNVAVTEN
jgi:hypothetical protein